jgi:acyl-CoA thioester hydrolase
MHIYKRTVQYHETDKMGITHHSNYVKYMEEARVSYLDAIGLPFTAIEEKGIVSPVAEIKVRYKSPSTFADVLEIKVMTESYNGMTFHFVYEMKKGDTVVALASSAHAFLNKDGRICSLKSVAPEYDAILRAEAEKDKEFLPR